MSEDRRDGRPAADRSGKPDAKLRADRLAAELRANLARRKSQSRARQAATSAQAEAEPDQGAPDQD